VRNRQPQLIVDLLGELLRALTSAGARRRQAAGARSW
jgi:hypothetical protein